MKRQGLALVAGAALVAGLIGANFGVAQANADSTAAAPQKAAVVCADANGAEQAVVRAEAPAPANAEVACAAADGAEQVGTSAEGLEQPASPDSGKAGDVTSAAAPAGISKASSPKAAEGQIALAIVPSDDATTVDVSR
ncbi:MAG TPA: hypothetical protein VGD69_19165 [Herpetosiphonaceae bacterium]